MVERRQLKATVNKMKDIELDLLKNAEFKEAFDEFDQVRKDTIFVLQFKNYYFDAGALALTRYILPCTVLHNRNLNLLAFLHPILGRVAVD